MEVTLIYADGTESEPFNCDEAYTVNDIAFVDGVMHTDVQDVDISA